MSPPVAHLQHRFDAPCIRVWRSPVQIRKTRPSRNRLPVTQTRLATANAPCHARSVHQLIPDASNPPTPFPRFTP